MKGTREEIRKRFLFPILLSLVVAIAIACTGVGGEGMETPARGGEATTAPITTATATMTAAPATTTAPVATAVLASTITPTTTRTTSTPVAGPLSDEELVSALRGGGYVIFFRHAATDPVPDDADPVVLSDCSTQRNLSTAGETQSRAIGQAIERLEIPIGLMLSSPFCRALDTARLAFGKATSEPALENLETSESEAEREARIEALRRLLSVPPEGNGATNSVLVAHGFNISAAANVTIAEGEAAIFRPEGDGGFTLVATVTSQEWEELAAQLAGDSQ